jgi:hypothetical protein
LLISINKTDSAQSEIYSAGLLAHASGIDSISDRYLSVAI